jgi:hypothetical protein
MTDALHAALAVIQAEHGGAAVDLLAVSLATEFAARAKCEAPHSVRRLALVSPTGFRGAKLRYGPVGGTWACPGCTAFHLERLAPGYFQHPDPPWRDPLLFAAHLGGKRIDEALWRYAVLTARQPGASDAPFYFVSAFLFSADINALYEALDGPVWVSMATRGDFTDYQGRHAGVRPSQLAVSCRGGRCLAVF